MSIRLRLTIWYVALLAVMLGLFSSFVYVLFERNLVEEMDGSLNDRATEMIRFLTASGPASVYPRLPQLDAFASGEIFIQLLDADGNILDKSSNLGRQRVPVDPESLMRIARTGSDFETLQAERVSLRVFTLPLVSNGRVIGYVQVARSLDELSATMSRLRQVLAFGSIITLSVAFVVGTIIAQRALKPMDRIIETARRIGVSGNLNERVRTRGPRDEIGRLAATFNGMLDRLAEAYRRQEQALAAQRRFVADASHELRTPLTTIRGNLDLLARHPDLSPTDREEALADAASEARRMSRLVDDLLFLARADAGQRLTKTNIAADEIIREVVRQARLLATGQKVIAGPIAAATIVASPDHFKQLLLILVDNAVKYTPPGGEIHIGTTVTGDPAEMVITISDTGPGIPATALPHIFERFYRAEASRGGSGTGLGLAIARWIVDEHDGAIDVQSEQGGGTTFTIRLPVLSTPEPATALAAAKS